MMLPGRWGRKTGKDFFTIEGNLGYCMIIHDIMCDVTEKNWLYVGQYTGDFQEFTQNSCVHNIFLAKETQCPCNTLKPLFGFSSLSLAAMSKKNMSDICNFESANNPIKNLK